MRPVSLGNAARAISAHTGAIKSALKRAGHSVHKHALLAWKALLPWLYLRRKPKALEEFAAWWRTEPPEPTTTIEYTAWREKAAGRGQTNEQLEADYIRLLDAVLSDPKQVLVWTLSGDQPVPSISSYKALVRHLSFHKFGVKAELRASSSRFHSIALTGNPKVLILDRCWIGHLSVQPARHMVMLTACYIGSLELHGAGSLTTLTMKDCVVLSASVDQENPFSGPVLLSDVWLPRDGDTANVQSLRDVRARLNARQNQLAAGVFHSAELALDRRHEPLWSRVFGYIYEVGCDYGNSIARPMKWLAFAIVAMAVAVYLGDAVETGDKAADLFGWHKDLKDREWLRAVVYPFVSVFNPLGIFSKTLLVAKTWWWSLLLTTLSLIGTTALAFVVIALRRRFKLE